MFWTFAVILLLPNSKSTSAAPTALSNSLCISWSFPPTNNFWFNSIWLPPITLSTIIPVCFGTVDPLAKYDTLSPVLRLDTSKEAFVINDEYDVVNPVVSNLNLLAVLYNQELKNTVFLVLSLANVGLGISSPKFLTVIFSPSRVTLASLVGSNSKSDRTPVILNSTLLVKSPSSYPNINSSLLKSSVDLIETPIPVQFKNWLIVLSV